MKKYLERIKCLKKTKLYGKHRLKQ